MEARQIKRRNEVLFAETVTAIINEVVEQMCVEYCKWPVLWNEETEGVSLDESGICDKCPLNRL